MHFARVSGKGWTESALVVAKNTVAVTYKEERADGGGKRQNQVDVPAGILQAIYFVEARCTSVTPAFCLR